MKSKLEQKIQEIENRGYQKERLCSCSKDVPMLLAALRECRKQRNEKLKAYLTVHPCSNASGMTIDEEVQFEAESDDNKLLKILE